MLVNFLGVFLIFWLNGFMFEGVVLGRRIVFNNIKIREMPLNKLRKLDLGRINSIKRK